MANGLNRMVALIALTTAAQGAVALDLGFELGGEYMRWEEYHGGDRLLDEQGMRTRFAVALLGERGGLYDWRSHVGMLVGQLAYSGQDWNGAPVGTSTNYFGVEAQLELSLNRTLWLDLHPTAAYNYAAWSRAINGAGGYTEHYTLSELSVGLERRLGEVGSWGYHVALGQPLMVDEQTKVLGVELTLEPDPRPMFKFGVAYRARKQLTVTLDYLGYRFGESSPSAQTIPYDQDGDGVDEQVHVVQPQSHLDRFAVGVQIGFN